MSRHIEREKIELPRSPDILVVGSGEVGEKAQQLIDKTPALQTLGFRVPRRTVLAEGFSDDFFQRNGLGANLRDVNINETTESNVRRGFLAPGQFGTLQRLCQSYGKNTPLVIRSSAG